MKTLLLLTSCLCCLFASSALAETVAYEPFAAYHTDLNLGADDQLPSPASTGVLDYTTGNDIVTQHVRADSLIFGSVETTGGKLHMNSGGVALTGAVDTSAGSVFADFIDAGGVGSAKGGDLWMSFLFRMEGTSTSVAQCYFALKNGTSTRLQMGQNWGASTFYASTNLGITLDEQTHLYVVKIEYRASGERVLVWFDPDLSSPIEGQTPNATLSRDMVFDTFEFKAQGNTCYIDEIRFATTAAEVVPQVQTYTLDLSAGANGSVASFPNVPEYLVGTQVRLEAEGDFGYKFVRWEGDVDAADAQTNPLTVTMNQNRAISAVFEAGVPSFFSFLPGADPYTTAAGFDLRHLNEDVAGQDGWITQQDDKFVLGNGQPVRFWAATTGAPSGTGVNEMARFLAKRGINMVRYHASVYDNNAPNMGDVNMARVDDLHRLVVAAKNEGIYTKVSFFFILGLRMQPEWGIDGFTSEWLAANPNFGAPFAIQFFDEDFKNAYKNWASAVMTTPNPYDPQNLSLANDPAAAIVEIQNEDNLFFWTFTPSSWPPEQQAKADGAFGTWLIDRYGSIAAAQTAWGGASMGRDNPAGGRMTLGDAWSMTPGYIGTNAARQKRMADQILFLTEVQYDFYVEMRNYMETQLGVQALFTGSNWHTAENSYLLDAEYYSYTAAGVIDSHRYFSPYISDKGVGTVVSGGDKFYTIPAINNPRANPMAAKQVDDHPSIISESTWTLPTTYKSESALVVAAYGALNDIDAFFWFATGQPGWQRGHRTWDFVTPAITGMFPAAALMYRRGDVQEGPVVVREGRTPQDIANQNPPLIQDSRGWDVTRDPDQIFDYDPTGGEGEVDRLAMMVGKVEIGFDTDDDFVDASLDTFIDTDNKTVVSATGELTLNWGTPKGVNPANPTEGSGQLEINTPLSQGATGWMAAAGPLALSDVTIDMRNEWGAVLATAMDGLPLAESREILIAAGTREWLQGYEETDVTMSRSGQDYVGKQIVKLGDLPWQMEGIDATVVLHATDMQVDSVHALDPNGYEIAALSVSSDAGGHTIDLPGSALYTLVRLSPAQGVYYANWDAFTPAEMEDPSVSGLSADPDFDKVVNLIEWMRGTNPKVADADAASLGPVLVNGGLELNFSVRDNDLEHTWRIETSRDLNAWNHEDDGTGAFAGAVTTSVSATEGFVDVTYIAPSSLDQPLFVRLNVLDRL